mgnify:CR=1 FL=1
MAILMTIALLPTGASAAEAKTWAVTGPDAIPGITPVIKTWAATGADAILDIAPAAIKVTESPCLLSRPMATLIVFPVEVSTATADTGLTPGTPTP